MFKNAYFIGAMVGAVGAQMMAHMPTWLAIIAFAVVYSVVCELVDYLGLRATENSEEE